MSEREVYETHYPSSGAALDAAESGVLVRQALADENGQLEHMDSPSHIKWHGGHRTLASAIESGRVGLDIQTAALVIAGAEVGTGKRRAFSYDVAGGSVDVGRYLMGVPDCMTRFQARPSPLMVHLGVGASVCADVPAERLRAHGVKLLAVVRALEAAGIRVCMDMVYNTVGTNNSALCVTVRVKDFGAPSDPQTVAYWTTDVGAFRWVAFKLWRMRAPPNVYAHAYRGHLGRPRSPDASYIAKRWDLYLPSVTDDNDNATPEQIAEQALTAARERARLGAQ